MNQAVVTRGLPLSLVLALAGSAGAQQFMQETTTRFPAPNPADYTNYIAVGDIDADGDLDLIFANGGNFSTPGSNQAVRIFINSGIGVFTDESATRINHSGLYRSAALGDIDLDGDDDLLLAADFNRQPKLFLNDGTGVFTDATAGRLPVMTLSSSRGTFGDIDNDGDLDIYINHGGATNRFGCGQNKVWVNNGAGVFADETVARHPAGTVCEPMDVLFVDVDNDLDLDIRTGNRGTNNSKLYRNSGAGVFTVITGLPGDSNCYSYDAGDMNGDGNFDLLGANAGGSNTELLLRGDGTGAFTNVSGQLSPNPTADDNDSKFFDLDNDGDQDLIIAALGGAREKIYINGGTGNFVLNSTIISAQSDSSLDVAVADFDNDGDPDIVTAQGESGNFQNRYYNNTGSTPDTRAPRVLRQTTVPAPAPIDPAGYVIRAIIVDDVSSDRGFFDKGVTLHYSVDAGPEETTPMLWSGNSLWRGVIPSMPAGAHVEFWVTALDWALNEGTGPTGSFDVENPDVAGDVDGDGDVDFQDLLALLAEWGPCAGCPADFNGDDVVGFDDLLVVLSNWD